jgi:hypothetical protein
MQRWNSDSLYVPGLPEMRKRPNTLGSPSVAEFYAAIAKHRTRNETAPRVTAPDMYLADE